MIILIILDNNKKNFKELNICLLHSIQYVIYIYIIKQHRLSVQKKFENDLKYRFS
ncbi:hypothetical protein SAMN05660293_00966 [Dyadobacter psychrophilus]|uniref:Uncharacterized protein n=1 Tax=Dyadobacter psychrophilus TaxID=651661 RepID=A0A1T5C7J1_9BACT|nr:hypothetical protein SAMN05660293_00966 [Dyadobacter psychrophilus]